MSAFRAAAILSTFPSTLLVNNARGNSVVFGEMDVQRDFKVVRRHRDFVISCSNSKCSFEVVLATSL